MPVPFPGVFLGAGFLRDHGRCSSGPRLPDRGPAGGPGDVHHVLCYPTGVQLGRGWTEYYNPTQRYHLARR